MPLRLAVKWLLVLALALPVIQAVLVWIVSLLRSMNDIAGAEILGHVSTGCQVVWSICLVGLLILLSLVVLRELPPNEQE